MRRLTEREGNVTNRRQRKCLVRVREGHGRMEVCCHSLEAQRFPDRVQSYDPVSASSATSGRKTPCSSLGKTMYLVASAVSKWRYRWRLAQSSRIGPPSGMMVCWITFWFHTMRHVSKHLRIFVSNQHPTVALASMSLRQR